MLLCLLVSRVAVLASALVLLTAKETLLVDGFVLSSDGFAVGAGVNDQMVVTHCKQFELGVVI